MALPISVLLTRQSEAILFSSPKQQVDKIIVLSVHHETARTESILASINVKQHHHMIPVSAPVSQVLCSRHATLNTPFNRQFSRTKTLEILIVVVIQTMNQKPQIAHQAGSRDLQHAVCLPFPVRSLAAAHSLQGCSRLQSRRWFMPIHLKLYVHASRLRKNHRQICAGFSQKNGKNSEPKKA